MCNHSRRSDREVSRNKYFTDCRRDRQLERWTTCGHQGATRNRSCSSPREEVMGHRAKRRPETAVRRSDPGRTKFWTVAGGYVPEETRLARDPSGKLPGACTIRMTRAVTVGGIVLDASGKPLSGVEVNIRLKEPATGDRPSNSQIHGDFHSCKIALDITYNCTRLAPSTEPCIILALKHGRTRNREPRSGGS